MKRWLVTAHYSPLDVVALVLGSVALGNLFAGDYGAAAVGVCFTAVPVAVSALIRRRLRARPVGGVTQP